MDRHEYLYHGSSKLFEIIMPFQTYDWGYIEGCHNAVFATSNCDSAIAFALGAIPDEEGRIERTMDKKYGEEIKMIFSQGHPNFGGKGYIYKVLSEGFIYTRGTQWVNPCPVTPIEVIEINVDDYLHLFRFATDEEKWQIETEYREAIEKRPT